MRCDLAPPQNKHQAPTFGRRAGPSKLFANLPPHLAELSMPDYQVWKRFMTDKAMGTALEAIDPVALAKLKAPIDVVDIGSGYGDFTFHAMNRAHFAKLQIGQPGPVIGYGFDIVPEVTQFAQRQAKRRGMDKLGRASFIPADILDPGARQMISHVVPDDSTALVLLSSMFHMGYTAKRDMLREAYRMLKPGGRILLTHWFKGYKHRGPEDALRPRPDHIAQWALSLPTEGKLEFAGFKRLNDGLFMVTLQKPLTALPRSVFEGLTGDYGQPLNRQDALARIMSPVRKLQNATDAYVYMEGLMDYLWQNDLTWAARVERHYYRDYTSSATPPPRILYPSLMKALDRDWIALVDEAYERRYGADPTHQNMGMDQHIRQFEALAFDMSPPGWQGKLHRAYHRKFGPLTAKRDLNFDALVQQYYQPRFNPLRHLPDWFFEKMGSTYVREYERYKSDTVRQYKFYEACLELMHGVYEIGMKRNDGNLVRTTFTRYPWLLAWARKPHPLFAETEKQLAAGICLELGKHPQWIPKKTEIQLK